MTSEFLLHGFVDQAAALFDEAERQAEDDEILRRVEVARLPVMYVELSQRYAQYEVSKQLSARVRFQALLTRFETLLEEHDVTVRGERLAFVDWLAELRTALAHTPDSSQKRE